MVVLKEVAFGKACSSVWDGKDDELTKFYKWVENQEQKGKNCPGVSEVEVVDVNAVGTVSKSKTNDILWLTILRSGKKPLLVIS